MGIFVFIVILNANYVYVCILLYIHMFMCLEKPEGSVRYPGIWITDSYEPLSVDAKL